MNTPYSERRRSFRVCVAGTALVDHGGSLDGVYDLGDVSIEGCALHRRERTELVSDRAAVTIALRVHEGAELELAARVVRHAVTDDCTQLGLRFSQASAAYEDLIQDLVIARLEQQRAAGKPRGNGRQRRPLPPDVSVAREPVLVVHAHPDRERVWLQRVRELGHRVALARTPRDAVAVLERMAQRIRVAFVADVVGTSRARDIMKLIVSRFPHVQCVPMSAQAAEHLLHGTQEAAARPTGRRTRPWSLARLRKVSLTSRRRASA